MNYEKIRLGLEKLFCEEIYEVIQGKIISNVLKIEKMNDTDNRLQNLMEGHHFMITRELSDELYELCQEIIKKLDFQEDIDFYICSQSDINAMSIAPVDDQHSHVIAF